MIRSEVFGCIRRVACIRSLISPGVLVSDEILALIQKALSGLAELRHLWSSRDVRLRTKDNFTALQFTQIYFLDEKLSNLCLG